MNKKPEDNFDENGKMITPYVYQNPEEIEILMKGTALEN